MLAARSDVNSTLKGEAQTTSRRRKGLSGKAVIVVQIALSTLLVVGAGFFLRTLIALHSVDVGFNADHLLLFEIKPPGKLYPAGKDVQFHSQLEQAFAAVPGVERVAPGTTAYISQSVDNSDFLPEGEAFDEKKGQAEHLQHCG